MLGVDFGADFTDTEFDVAAVVAGLAVGFETMGDGDGIWMGTVDVMGTFETIASGWLADRDELNIT
jgi:hypothetical protein